MYNPLGDPRFSSQGHGAPNPQSQAPYGQPAQAFGQAHQQQSYGQPQAYAQPTQPQPQPYAQPTQPQPQAYAQPTQPQPYAQPMQAYGQQPYSQPPPQPTHAYGQQPYAPPSHHPASPQPSTHAPAPAPSFGMPGLPGMGAFGGLAGAGLGRAGAALPQVSGLPSAVAFAMGIVAVVVALVFDVIFLKVHIPGIGGYAWYLTTALSFAGAGYFGIKWTRATQSTAMAAVAVAGVLYGVADIGLGLVLEDLAMGSAMFLGIQGLVIACVCGGGGVRKALGERG